MTIHISSTLDLPIEWLLLGTIIYGMPETGKSVLGRVVAEEAAKAGVRFCIHDIKGDHYGLKSSADGKQDGLPVVVFGGDHADLPLNIRAGAAMGAFVSKFDQSCIIDYEHFNETEYLGFVADFSDALYHHNRQNPIVSIYDEAQQLAPQTPDGTKEARRCLAAVKKFSRLGRKHACGRIFLAQRGADVHKGVSELCETLVSFRAPGTLDQERIKRWLGSKLPKERVQELVSGLNDLPTGTALFASAHPKVNVFGFHKVRRPDTFDSSSTPSLGKTRAEPIRLAKPALEKIAKQLASTIEEAQGEDPAALRRELSRERALRIKAANSLPPWAAAPPPMEVPMWDPEAFAELESKVHDHVRLLSGNITGALHVYKSKCLESNGAKYGLGGKPRPAGGAMGGPDFKTTAWGPGGEPPRSSGRVVSAGGGGGGAYPSHEPAQGGNGRPPVIGPGGFLTEAAAAEVWRRVVTDDDGSMHISTHHNPKDWTQMEEDLYQKFKARMISEAQTDPKILQVLVRLPELEVNIERELVQVDGKSLRGRIAQLAAQGFFADERAAGHVFKELNRTGAGVNSGNVSRELSKFVGFGILTRESDKYLIAPGAQVRLKKDGR